MGLVGHSRLQQSHASTHGVRAAAVGEEQRGGHLFGGSYLFIVTATLARHSHIG